MKIINFRDVVTNFSIGGITKQKITFYAKRLAKESSARRLASFLLIGLLVFQLFTFISPPQRSSASSSDIIAGGFANLDQLLAQYDANTGSGSAGIHTILDSIGINREDLQNSSFVTWQCVPGLLSMGWGGGGNPSVNGTTVGECGTRWGQGSISGIKLNRKVFADIGFGAQWYEVGILGSCANLVFLPTSPPDQPEPTFSCATLNYTTDTTTAGGAIGFRGYANGQNVGDGDLVTMVYQMTDVNDVPLSEQTAGGVSQQGGVYIDPELRSFAMPTPGTFKMRLWVHYNDKNNQDALAAGSAEGSCIRTVTVTSQKSLVCAQLDIVTKTGQVPFTPGLKGTARVIGDSGQNVFPGKFTYILLTKVSGTPAPGAPVINYQGTNYLEGNPTGGTTRIEHTNANPAVLTDPASGPAFFASEFTQTSPGEFLIILRVDNQDGVAAPENPNNCYVPFSATPPPSNFACKGLKANPSGGPAPLADVILTGEASVLNTAVESYEFDFGDGAKQTVASTALTASSAKHTYQNAGSYTATVAIKTNRGTTNPNSCKTTITVTPPIFLCRSLSATPSTGPTPLEVTLSATATVSNAKVQSFEFDFGDGTPKQTINTDQPATDIKHTYVNPGRFTASVIVKTDKGTAPASDDCKIPITPTDIRYTKTVSNLTLLTVDGKPTDANNQVAKAGDTLRYQIAVCNATSSAVKNFIFEDDVTDLLYYTDLADLGGATKVVTNGQTKLVWPAEDIPPLPAGQACTDASGNLIVANFANSLKSFTVKVKDPIPASPSSSADASAYNCQIQDEFHGSIVITPIGVTPAKQVECAVIRLPQTGAGAPIFFVAFFAAASAFLFFRNRLLKRELKLVETLNDGSGGGK